MPKIRVYELAKELGLDSETLLATLNELGEFVKSPSSIVEPPVERRLRELHQQPPGGRRTPPPARRRQHGPQARPRGATSTTAWPKPNPRSPQVAGSTSGQSLSDAQAQAALIFGEAAVRATGAADARSGAFPDGYGYSWQQRFIEHKVFTDFMLNGLNPHEADLAYEILLTGLRPAQLGIRLGDHTILEWLRFGHPVERVARTLRDPEQRVFLTREWGAFFRNAYRRAEASARDAGPGRS